MKAFRDSLAKAFRLHGPWAVALLLCQCSLPPREAWQYIQTNGLLTYWNYEAGQPSPPFGVRGASQRYAARSSYAAPRYTQRPSSSWSSYWGSGMPNRVLYQAAPRSAPPSRYYAAPSQPQRPSYTPRSAPQGPSRPRISPPVPSSPSRIPIEEPASPTPPVARTQPPSPSLSPSSMPRSNAPAPGAPAATADLPYGTPVPGRPNMVNSPYAGKTQLVDVSGMGVGQTVKCPYTGKLFKVPPPQQAANNASSPTEPKADSPKAGPEPKDGDKKP